jgi:hypothetical protein
VGLPTPSGYEDWVHLAEIRIINILRQRLAANIRQLEAKVSESGPPKKRSEPHILQAALKRLMARGKVKPIYVEWEKRNVDTAFIHSQSTIPSRQASA